MSDHNTEPTFRAKAEKLASSIPYSPSLTAVELAQTIGRISRNASTPLVDQHLAASVAYCWVAKNLPYDIASLDPRTRLPQNPDRVLKERKAVCEGYSCLYAFLLNQLSIEATVIHGLARAGVSDLGQVRTQAESGHAWAAVKWDSAWHLVDCTWGAGTVSGGAFEESFTWDRFDMDARLAAYSHHPEDSNWQLLPTPWTEQEFFTAAIVDPVLFTAIQMNLSQRLSDTVTVRDRDWVWRWKAASGMRLLSTVAPASQPSGGASTTADSIINPQGETEFRFPNLPQGRYHLKLFAKAANTPADRPFEFAGAWLADVTVPVSSNKSPVTYKKFGELGLQLMQPLSGHLASGGWQDFEITGPSGLSLALQRKGETTLSYLSYQSGSYRGRIMVQPGELSLCLVEERSIWQLVDYDASAR